MEPGVALSRKKIQPHGGHLSHGRSASITSQCSAFKHHTLDPATKCIGCDQIRGQAHRFSLRMNVAGDADETRKVQRPAYGRLRPIISGGGNGAGGDKSTRRTDGPGPAPGPGVVSATSGPRALATQNTLWPKPVCKFDIGIEIYIVPLRRPEARSDRLNQPITYTPQVPP